MAGIPVGTSLIDAHAGGVGVMESVPKSDPETLGYRLIKTFLFSCCNLVVALKQHVYFEMYMLQILMRKPYVIAWF